MNHIILFEKFYHPPTEVRSKLDNIVSNLLKKYKGGKEFFDALDDSIKNVINKDIILSLLRGNNNEWVATSGEFGERVYQLYKEGKFKCKGVVVFNGKMLTQDRSVEFWFPKEFNLNDKNFVYVDDSYFSGGTVKKINDFLNKQNSKIKNVHVVYDGSKEKRENVNSYFRYYS
jgi:hypothetical protein